MEPLSFEELRLAGRTFSQTFDREKKDLGAYLLAARTLIHAALGLAQQHPEQAADYKRITVMTSYNMAAACWPGWEDAYPEITDEQRSLAMEMCLFNVATGEALDLPPERRANSQWILGAHLLANGDYAAARNAFELASDLKRQGGERDGTLMSQGWVLMCDLLEGDNSKRAELDKVIAELKTLGEDGEFYAGQYEPALKTFGWFL